MRLLPGPDLDAFEPDALGDPARGALRRRDARAHRRAAARRDRCRAPPAYASVSRPMVRGAIEVPADGQPIVLGPDHPTTGGYPILAVVASADLERVFATRARAVHDVA